MLWIYEGWAEWRVNTRGRSPEYKNSTWERKRTHQKKTETRIHKTWRWFSTKMSGRFHDPSFSVNGCLLLACFFFICLSSVLVSVSNLKEPNWQRHLSKCCCFLSCVLLVCFHCSKPLFLSHLRSFAVSFFLILDSLWCVFSVTGADCDRGRAFTLHATPTVKRVVVQWWQRRSLQSQV